MGYPEMGRRFFIAAWLPLAGSACRVFQRRRIEFRIGWIVHHAELQGKLCLFGDRNRSQRRRLRGRRQLRCRRARVTSPAGQPDYNLGSGIDADVPLTGTYVQSGTALTVKLTDGGTVDDSFTTTLATSGSSPIANFDSSGSGNLYPQTTSGFTPVGAYAYTVQGEQQGTLTGSGQLVVAAGDFVQRRHLFGNRRLSDDAVRQRRWIPLPARSRWGAGRPQSKATT